MLLSAQIAKKQNLSSPCALCHKTFTKTHTCNVSTQVAVLLLHGLNLMDSPLNRHVCELCQEEFTTASQLHGHLSKAHSVQVHDWRPARDALPDSSACAHCGSSFETKSGLRRHILDGRCSSFDPGAPDHLPNAAEVWREPLHQGALYRGLLTPQQRQRLTLVCQLCGTS